MNLLLDTHTLLWLADGDPQLSATAEALILDPANTVYLSIASKWEIAIKSGLKKLNLTGGYTAYVADAVAGYNLTELPIEFLDCVAYESLPFPLARHRDPFDRMLVTQALRLNLSVVGADTSFDAYGVARLW